MNFNDSEMVDIEIEMTMEVLRRYEYPDYEDVIEKIENIPQEYVEISEWLDEYGEENHECTEAIWSNMFDRGLIQTMGEEINNRGGFVSMQGCYYILLMFLELFIKRI